MPVAFLDFEASSLGSASYPIEVGWAIDAEDAEAHLIRPAPGWTVWSAASERVHGIGREHLIAEGRAYGVVARRLAEVLGRCDVIVASDNADFDQFWLEQLMQAAFLPVPCIVRPACTLYLEAARDASNGGLGRDAAAVLVTSVLEADRLRLRARHRAGPDALAMLWVLQEVRRRGAREMSDA